MKYQGFLAVKGGEIIEEENVELEPLTIDLLSRLARKIGEINDKPLDRDCRCGAKGISMLSQPVPLDGTIWRRFRKESYFCRECWIKQCWDRGVSATWQEDGKYWVAPVPGSQGWEFLRESGAEVKEDL